MRNLLLIFLVFFALSLSAQDQERLKLGLVYSYQTLDMKLTSGNIHGFAKGVDLGDFDLSDEKIDQINERNTINKTCNIYGLSVGYDIINTNNWSVTGMFSGGINVKTLTIDDDSLGKQYGINNSDPNFWTGISINIERHLNNKWSVVANPSYFYSWGEDTDIFNSSLLETGIMTVSENNIANYQYLSLPIMAKYSVGKFNFMAGSEFYYAFLKNEATVIKYDALNDAEYKDIFNYKFQSCNFLAASAMVSWEFLPKFSLTVKGLYGKDVQFNSSIVYHFNSKNSNHEN